MREITYFIRIRDFRLTKPDLKQAVWINDNFHCVCKFCLTRKIHINIIIQFEYIEQIGTEKRNNTIKIFLFVDDLNSLVFLRFFHLKLVPSAIAMVFFNVEGSGLLLPGLHKKRSSVTRVARELRFFSVCRSLFVDYIKEICLVGGREIVLIQG